MQVEKHWSQKISEIIRVVSSVRTDGEHRIPGAILSHGPKMPQSCIKVKHVGVRRRILRDSAVDEFGDNLPAISNERAFNSVNDDQQLNDEPFSPIKKSSGGGQSIESNASLGARPLLRLCKTVRSIASSSVTTCLPHVANVDHPEDRDSLLSHFYREWPLRGISILNRA
jgi:hypothetical protein